MLYCGNRSRSPVYTLARRVFFPRGTSLAEPLTSLAHRFEIDFVMPRVQTAFWTKLRLSTGSSSSVFVYELAFLLHRALKELARSV